MCVNIKNVNPEDMAKLAEFVKGLNGGDNTFAENVDNVEQGSTLGILLQILAMSILAGEDTHLPHPEAVEEMQRRAEENLGRLSRGEEPKMEKDFVAEAAGVTTEDLDRMIQEQMQRLQGGIVPPGAYTPPQGGGHNTIQPIQAPKPDDGEDFRGGMYL